MYKIQISFFLMLYLCACQAQSKTKTDWYVTELDRKDSVYQFTDIERKVTITRTTLKVDTTVSIRRIPKRRIIFKRGKIYTYDVAYIDVNGDTLSHNKIELIPLGRRDPMALNQDDFVFNNAYSTSDSLKFPTCPLNKSYKFRWEKQAMEGAVENSEEVWMHPLRQNHYFFTETAPFPVVHFPIYIGQKWKEPFEIWDGGDWSNQKGQHSYRVVNKVDRIYGDINLSCWQIVSDAKFEFGTSHLTYYFNEQNGFVEMNYINYVGQKLNLILQKIEYKKDLSHIRWDNLKNFWMHDALTD
jgi:hypothetical protein